MSVNESQIVNNSSYSKDRNIFRYAVVVEYNGKCFSGSQMQVEQRTVQSELENALSILTKQKVKTIFSGRTDSGVHAKGQVAHFDLNKQLEEYKFLYSLNSILSEDISISCIKQVCRSFHSQQSALYRWYRYTINNSKQRSVWSSESLHVHKKLNLEEMNKSLQYLLGTHDFSSFKSSGTANPSTVCTMLKAECTQEFDSIHVDLVGNRFLYNMVRIIVGTLIDIGSGSYPAEHMRSVLNSKDRANAGKTVSPNGLTFMFVGYNKKYNIYDVINREAIFNENIFSKAS